MNSLVGDGGGRQFSGTDATPLHVAVWLLTGTRGVLGANLCTQASMMTMNNASSSSTMKPSAWNLHPTPPEPSTTAYTTHQPPKQQPSAGESGFLASRRRQGPQRRHRNLPKITAPKPPLQNHHPPPFPIYQHTLRLRRAPQRFHLNSPPRRRIANPINNGAAVIRQLNGILLGN